MAYGRDLHQQYDAVLAFGVIPLSDERLSDVASQPNQQRCGAYGRACVRAYVRAGTSRSCPTNTKHKQCPRVRRASIKGLEHTHTHTLLAIHTGCETAKLHRPTVITQINTVVRLSVDRRQPRSSVRTYIPGTFENLQYLTRAESIHPSIHPAAHACMLFIHARARTPCVLSRARARKTKMS